MDVYRKNSRRYKYCNGKLTYSEYKKRDSIGYCPADCLQILNSPKILKLEFKSAEPFLLFTKKWLPEKLKLVTG